jgi:opacity protein-like surface antigen
MNSLSASLLGTALLLPSLSAGAAEPPPRFKLEVTPYAWLAGVEGDVTVNGRQADFDKSFSDIFDMVEVGGSLLTIAQYDRFIFWGQIDYFSMSTDELDVDDQPKAGTLDSSMLLGELAAGIQVDGWREGQTFDLLVGVRTLSIENDLDLRNGTSTGKDQDLVDPILVVRPSVPLFPSKIEGLRFNPTLAIGGGGDSDLVYELQPQIQYQVSENLAARIGYRRVGYKLDSDQNDNELDFSLSGLIVGLGIRF